jgi:hypothetical protein
MVSPTQTGRQEGSNEGGAATPPAKRRVQTWWEFFRDTYLVFDRRTLGITRIFLGFFLIFDLFRRTPDWLDMFADNGVLPAHVILNRPQANGFSILHGFSHAPELWALWCVILFTYVMLLLGWRTKIWQVLSLLWVTSMNGRVLLIENGGYVVHNLLLLWTMFLPLGSRFSLDALLESLKRRREASEVDLNDRSELTPAWRFLPHVSIVGLILCFQIAAIYYFNVVHKTGPAWKNGTAVHFVMYVDRMVNPLIGHTRELIPFPMYLFMTKMVMSFEAAIPLCIFSPLAKPWARRAIVFMMIILHVGFGSTFVLGPFAWALCVFSILLFTRDDWEVAYRTMRKPEREVTVLYDPRSPATLLFCRILARLDRFELVWFESDPTVANRFAVRDLAGKVHQGVDGLHAIARALPAGPAFAWWLRLPVLRQLVEAALRKAQDNTSRIFGMKRPTGPVQGADRSPARVRMAWLGHAVSQVLALAFFVGALNQAAVELWTIKRRWKVPQPEVTRVFSHKLRFLQGWFMFSPNPVMDDGTIIVDAVTEDGRHVDPFWQKEPNFDLTNAKSFGYNQIWSDYFNRMHLAGNRNYRDAMIDYMRRLPERTGNPKDRLVSGEVYWVKDMNPKWKQRKSWNYQRELLFSFDENGRRTDAKDKKPDS